MREENHAVALRSLSLFRQREGHATVVCTLP